MNQRAQELHLEASGQRCYAIGSSLGSLIPAILLIWMRWIQRTVDTPKNALADDPQDPLQA